MDENKKNKSPLDGLAEAIWIHQMDHDLARQRERANVNDVGSSLQRQLDEKVAKDDMARIMKDLIKAQDDALNASDDESTNATQELTESKTDSTSATNKPTAKNVYRSRMASCDPLSTVEKYVS